ncbi:MULTISPECIES: chromate transporter [unclassified Acidovorax]|uniref:chromate transporter n=1 Tax=unclassified Acidovorax TaxID=2684926 RepID=UPI002882DFCE|nr:MULTISPECIES: chromate transporter [unclassified Acidovorax]
MPSPSLIPPSLPLAAPKSLADLFWSFTWLALQGFGGVLAVVQRELVDKKRWMTNDEFIEDWAVAQILPGPNVVNLAIMVGDRHFGLRGALVAVAGMLALPLVLVLALAMVYASFSSLPAVAGALRGMGAVAAGLVAAVGCKLAAPLVRHPLGPWLCGALALATFIAMVMLRVPLLWILLVIGGTACLLTWRRLEGARP